VRPLPALLGALGAVALLQGCSSSSSAPDACPPEYEKQVVASTAASWYLYPELLAQVDPTAYPDSSALLRALVAPAVAAGKDRGWSYVTSTAQQQQYYGEGNAVGFGVGLLVRSGTRLFVSLVYPASGAALAGFVRGDEILEVGDSEATLTPVSGLISAGTLSQALGPPEPGVTRTFRVAPLASPASPVLRSVTKGVYSLSPVAFVGTVPAGTAGLVRPVGVVVLNAFLTTAETGLRSAFAAFQADGITDLVVDLRYNGGGLLSTAGLLSNLLGGGLSGQTMYDLVDNPAHADLDARASFSPQPQSVPAVRVAFITTRASASASELVANAMEPYLAPAGGPANIALVGTRTYGKPVGQRGFNLTECQKVLYLVAFSVANADGEGSYFSGLPDVGFDGPLCDAADDLEHAQGTVGEASTAAALHWIANGACPPAPAAAMALPGAAPDEPLTPAWPTVAQRENPGLF
jgi:C-terminal processing protease CtpA/Prc